MESILTWYFVQNAKFMIEKRCCNGFHEVSSIVKYAGSSRLLVPVAAGLGIRKNRFVRA